MAAVERGHVGRFRSTAVLAAGHGAGGRERGQQRVIGQFSFLSATPTAEQPGLALSVSPDDGTGARMAYVRLEDTPSGIRVFAEDTPNHYGAEFDDRWLATLDRSVPHTIRFAMKLVKGEANDIVRISIDGTDVDCGTSWENYYRYAEKDPAKAPDYVRPIDRMQFRAVLPKAPHPAARP
jgi:hypothetical protein